ncbi:MAG: VOC family protein [Halanaerobiales bacterium]|nr:VOC family protein [Halanaerobiales bacterium]
MFDVEHIGLVVKDCECSLEFYSQALGCEYMYSHKDEKVKLVFVKAGTQVIEFVQYLDREYNTRQVGAIDHIAFRVKDIEAEVKRLKKLEVEFLYDEPIQVNEEMKIIFFVGPDGERLELVEKLN